MPAAAAPGTPANHEPIPSYSPLADPHMIATITGKTGITVRTSRTQLANTPARVQSRSCVSIRMGAQRSSYAAMEPVSAVYQMLADGEPGKRRSVMVIQAAVTTASDLTPWAHLNGLAEQWNQCAGTAMYITETDGTQTGQGRSVVQLMAANSNTSI